MPTRRTFTLGSTALLAATHSPQALANPLQSRQTIRVGVMGLSRGLALAVDFAKLPNVDVSYVCDVDRNRVASAAKQLEEQTGKPPKTASDWQTLLDSPDVDALVCAAPNHWHGPATILACAAGKHVYVEKPCSHNGQEGEWMLAAAKRYQRCVQVGTQRRSSPGVQAAIGKLHSGAIGTVRVARAYYNNLRGSIGRGTQMDAPQHVQYDLWQGPAAPVAYRDNILHYNWHWFWHWGGGELANNGVHFLDLCRWGLEVDFPESVVSSGGRYWFDDDQETPDVQSAAFTFPGEKRITWDALSCNKHRVNSFCEFYGDEGALELDGEGSFRIFDRNNRLVEESPATSAGQIEHLQNFIDAIRGEDASLLNQPVEEGHKSTTLCHLGNIAQRSGQTVRCDSANGHVLDNEQQAALWGREYAAGWQVELSGAAGVTDGGVTAQ